MFLKSFKRIEFIKIYQNDNIMFELFDNPNEELPIEKCDSMLKLQYDNSNLSIKFLSATRENFRITVIYYWKKSFYVFSKAISVKRSPASTNSRNPRIIIVVYFL